MDGADAYELSNKFDEALLRSCHRLIQRKIILLCCILWGVTSITIIVTRKPLRNGRQERMHSTGKPMRTAHCIRIISCLKYISMRGKIWIYEAMVYYSDHGEDLHISNALRMLFVWLRIPMFVYLSEDYRKAYPSRATALAHNQDRFFTNDMIYDTVCGIFCHHQSLWCGAGLFIAHIQVWSAGSHNDAGTEEINWRPIPYGHAGLRLQELLESAGGARRWDGACGHNKVCLYGCFYVDAAESGVYLLQW